MRITALVEALVAAGATPEMILAAVRTTESANEDALEQSREKTRARVAKWRSARDGNVTCGLVTAGNGSRGGDAHVEGNLLSQKIEPQESKKQDAQARDLDDFKSELSDLDPERVAALVKHRRTKRGQNSGLAARLFRRDAEACGLSLAEAADTCISRNWITVKPEYFNQPRGSPSPRKPSLADGFAEFAKFAGAQNDQRPAEDFGSAHKAIPHLSRVSNG